MIDQDRRLARGLGFVERRTRTWMLETRFARGLASLVGLGRYRLMQGSGHAAGFFDEKASGLDGLVSVTENTVGVGANRMATDRVRPLVLWECF